MRNTVTSHAYITCLSFKPVNNTCAENLGVGIQTLGVETPRISGLDRRAQSAVRLQTNVETNSGMAFLQVSSPGIHLILPPPFSTSSYSPPCLRAQFHI